MQNLTKIDVLFIAPKDCDNLSGIVYIYTMKKHRFLFGFLIFAITAILAGYGYLPALNELDELEKVQYTEGEFDGYNTKRKWRSRRKGKQPFRKYLYIYLEDDLARYEDSKYLLGNLEQNALLMVFDQWPRERIEIGYVETDDAGLRKIYNIKYQGESLVDMEGIKTDIKREAMMLLIFSIVAGILAVLSLIKYLVEKKKQVN
ncbi:hypothetical protein [Parvicella tangerina]|uniref:Uncharacterized protein n=1 Tax=Parvicella tangerina TaxID=2829795 RepID=A0A916NGV6_9FLAO|nr:hypothetical protein [Parvicella tangerina]CAG5081375.1 hypothetical protein CRYO30217_01612 [Parvicella tangerina]